MSMHLFFAPQFNVHCSYLQKGGGGKDQPFPFSPTLPPASMNPGKVNQFPVTSVYGMNGNGQEEEMMSTSNPSRNKEDGDFLTACQQST